MFLEIEQKLADLSSPRSGSEPGSVRSQQEAAELLSSKLTLLKEKLVSFQQTLQDRQEVEKRAEVTETQVRPTANVQWTQWKIYCTSSLLISFLAPVFSEVTAPPEVQAEAQQQCSGDFLFTQKQTAETEQPAAAAGFCSITLLLWHFQLSEMVHSCLFFGLFVCVAGVGAWAESTDWTDTGHHWPAGQQTWTLSGISRAKVNQVCVLLSHIYDLWRPEV